MNNPEYILVDEFAVIVSNVKAALSLPVLNYQYGYVTELAETLSQYDRAPDYSSKKYPLVWLVQPFSITRTDPLVYGTASDVRVFIIQETVNTLKSSERMAQTFKAVMYPIYRQLEKELLKSHWVFNSNLFSHQRTDRYYWGKDQQELLKINDVFDCMELSQIKLIIKNKIC